MHVAVGAVWCLGFGAQPNASWNILDVWQTCGLCCFDTSAGDGLALEFNLVNGLHSRRHSCRPEGVGGCRASAHNTDLSCSVAVRKHNHLENISLCSLAVAVWSCTTPSHRPCMCHVLPLHKMCGNISFFDTLPCSRMLQRCFVCFQGHDGAKLACNGLRCSESVVCRAVELSHADYALATLASQRPPLLQGISLAEQLQGHVKEAFASPHANHVLQRLGCSRQILAFHMQFAPAVKSDVAGNASSSFLQTAFTSSCPRCLGTQLLQHVTAMVQSSVESGPA